MYQIALVAFFAVAFGSALTKAETQCQIQKRNNGGNGPLQWDIQCDAQGNYLPLQCTRQTPKWCACYNGEGSITQPSRGTKSCECLLAKDTAEKNGLVGCALPTCERSGKFAKKQCCSTTGKCHCVDPMTGEKKTEPTNNKNLQCP